MATIDNLTLEITADANKATTSLNNLSTALGNLKSNLPTKAKLTNASEGFKALTSEISKLSLSAKNLNRIKAIGQIGNALSKISSVSPANIKKSAENLDALQGAISHISDEGVDRIERLARAFERLGRANKNMGVLGNVRKITNATATTPIQTTPAESGVTDVHGSIVNGDASNNIKNATSSLSNFWTKYQTISSMVKQNPISLFAMTESAEKMGGLAETLGVSVGAVTTFSKALGIAGIVISVVTGALGLLGKAFNKIISPIKIFVNSLKRIAMYRILRGILKSIAQGIKEGIQNLALYSKALEGLDAHNANNVLSRYASEFLYFKNAIATAIIPVLRGLIPYVETAINAIIKFVNVLAQVGSAIFGTEYTKAKYFWVDYADSLDDANGRAKALKHQLAGFDELNNLTDNTGGSGSTKIEDARNMFEEALIDPKIKNFVDDIVSKLRTGLGNVKTTIQPYVDKLKEVGNTLKQKVVPNVKKTYENLKKIWKETLKPILNEFFKGFFEGFASESFKNLPSALEKISQKVADFTTNLEKLTSKLPIDKLKEMAYQLGVNTGKFIASLNPVENIIDKYNAFKQAVDWAGTSIINLIEKALTPVIKKMVEGATKAKELSDKLHAVYEKVLNLQNPTSTLSAYMNTLKDKFVEFRDKLIAVKNYLDINNIFASGEANATAFETVVNRIKGVIEWFQRLGKIVIAFGIELSGAKNFTDGLATVAEKVGLPDLANSIKNDVSSVLKDTNPAKAQLPTSSKDTNSQKAQVSNTTLSPSDFGSIAEYQVYMKNLRGYASGGFPTGDLFIANEKGAEMVGRIGGNTAVANNNQITEAIAQATYTAMSQALSENGGSVNIVVEGDGDKMFRVFQKKQREYARDTGRAY